MQAGRICGSQLEAPAGEPPYPPQLDHGPLTVLLPDVAWCVEAWFALAPVARMLRTMTVVRCNGELSIFNSIRVDDDTLNAIAALGTVRHVVKLGFGHGSDDAWYLSLFRNAEYWTHDNFVSSRPSVTPAHVLAEGTPGPLGIQPIVFHDATKPEVAVVFKPTSGPGLLIVCDAIQSWGAAVPGEDIELSELRSSWDPRVLFGNAISFMLGFTQRAATPTMFFRFFYGENSQAVKDKAAVHLRRAFALDWDAIAFGHGRPLPRNAKTICAEAEQAVFGCDLRSA